MKLEVKLFAAARQLAGRPAIELTLDEPATVGQLRRTLVAEHPALADLVKRAMFSVNLDYAGDAATIPPGAEVACIPPVSGG